MKEKFQGPVSWLLSILFGGYVELTGAEPALSAERPC